MARHIVVVGAGFSGALTAVNLLRHAGGEPLRVTLLNRSGRMARGLAYGTASPEHLRQNVAWIKAPPDPDLLAEVQAILAPIHNQTWPSGRPENN